METANKFWRDKEKIAIGDLNQVDMIQSRIINKTIACINVEDKNILILK